MVDPSLVDDEGKFKFVPQEVAALVMSKNRFATHKQSHVIWAYGNGSYASDGEELIRAEVRGILGDKAKEGWVNEVVSHIRETTYTKPEKFEAPKYLINVENGILDIESGKLLEHTPDIIFTNELPVKYDSNATYPAITRFLTEILEESDIPLMQEITGYCLLRDYLFAKAIMFLGVGANAKSTMLRLIAALLGEENVATPSLHDLVSNRFTKAELYGKLANIHADISAIPLKYTGVFKMLTGQDLIWAEQKHKNPFTFRNYAKLLYSANELPRIEDTTEAFWRRWILIKFSRVFAENDPKTDPRIIEKLTTSQELSGFLNWALEGLKRLLKNGKFTTTSMSKEIEKEWVMQTDSLRAFTTQHTTFDLKYFASNEDFYTAYLMFCETHDLVPFEKGEIGRRLPTLTRARQFNPRIGGKQVRAWRGIRFSADFEAYHKTDITVPLGDFLKKQGEQQ
jgi:putative DNA primase/helicase